MLSNGASASFPWYPYREYAPSMQMRGLSFLYALRADARTVGLR